MKNHLLFILDKFQICFFDAKHKHSWTSLPYTITVTEFSVPTLNKTKTLGVILGAALTFELQVNDIAKVSVLSFFALIAVHQRVFHKRDAKHFSVLHRKYAHHLLYRTGTQVRRSASISLASNNCTFGRAYQLMQENHYKRICKHTWAINGLCASIPECQLDRLKSVYWCDAVRCGPQSPAAIS